MFFFVAVSPTQGHSQSFTQKKATLAGPVYGARRGKPLHLSMGCLALAGRVGPERGEGQRVEHKGGSHHPVWHHPPPQPQPRTPPLPRRARVQPGSSSPPPQGTSHPSALPFPSLLPFGKSRTFSSPKRLFPAGTEAPWSCPKSWPCLGQLSGPSSSTGSHSASSVPQLLHPNLQNIPTSPPVPPAQFQPQISQSPPWLQDTPTHPLPVPHGLLGLPGGSQAVARGTC